MASRTFAACAAVLLVTGCATISTRTLSTGAVKNGTYDGVLYYPPITCIVSLVTDKGPQMQVITVPDYSQPREVTWSGGLFTNPSPSVTLTSGWNLTGIESEGGTALGEFFAAAGAVAAAAVAVAPPESTSGATTLCFKPDCPAEGRCRTVLTPL